MKAWPVDQTFGRAQPPARRAAFRHAVRRHGDEQEAGARADARDSEGGSEPSRSDASRRALSRSQRAGLEFAIEEPVGIDRSR